MLPVFISSYMTLALSTIESMKKGKSGRSGRRPISRDTDWFRRHERSRRHERGKKGMYWVLSVLSVLSVYWRIGKEKRKKRNGIWVKGHRWQENEERHERMVEIDSQREKSRRFLSHLRVGQDQTYIQTRIGLLDVLAVQRRKAEGEKRMQTWHQFKRTMAEVRDTCAIHAIVT